MATDDLERQGEQNNEGTRRRRRRRRRRRGNSNEGSGEGSNGSGQRMNNSGDDGRRRGRRSRRGRGDGQPAVNLPSSGRAPRWRMAIHPRRDKVLNGTSRRRKLSRADMEQLAEYLNALPESLVQNLYRGMGGQPSRVTSKERMIQLAVRAVGGGSRLGNLIKTLHQRDRQALAILIQCGGIGQHAEFIQELMISLGGNEREWTKVMTLLANNGLVAASEEKEGHFFYLIPDPLIPHLLAHLHEDLVLPSFENEDVRVIDPRAFCPPLDFSLVTLSTYVDQHPPRLTQRHEIFKVHKDELDEFFAQLWEPDSELFSFHIEFLMMHGMVELRGDRLSVNRAVLDEWLQLDPEDQRNLILSSMEKRFPHAEWVLWAVHDIGGAWVPERPLQALYRRWRRGEDWRTRFHKGQWASPRTAEREGYTFSPLVNTSMLEMGQWGQEKFYRLTPLSQRLLNPTDEEGFSQFYLTPSFEIMAPAGMSPLLFFRIGELAELTACDRANTYKITQVSIEQALERGWRRDDILEFLRDYSQIGLPENVEQTLRGWMGHHGDVEYHDVMMLTVHRSQIRRLESHRNLKPFLLHRFVPGMYAVDRSRIDDLNEALVQAGFNPGASPRKYPDDVDQIDARKRLLTIVTEAREERLDHVAFAHAADTQPESLHPIPGTTKRPRRSSKRGSKTPPRCSPAEVREICESAVSTQNNLEMLYVTRDNQRQMIKVEPEQVAINHAGQQVLVARNLATNERLSYQLVQIERMHAIGKKK